MKHLLEQSGTSNTQTLLIVLGSILGIYFIWKYAPPYITYYQVRQAFMNVARQSSHLDDAQLQEELVRRLESINPPFTSNEVTIERQGRSCSIFIDYVEVVWHPIWDKEHRLYFEPRIEVEMAVP